MPPKLTIELVPETCHFSNLRTNLPRWQWDRLRHACYERAGNACEVCGGRGSAHPVEAHEIWDYDDGSRVQTLAGLTALCPACHRVKHMGLSRLRGWAEDAEAHLARVNQWTPVETSHYVKAAFEEWARRSAFHWRLDLSWLAGQGVRIPKTLDRFPNK